MDWQLDRRHLQQDATWISSLLNQVRPAGSEGYFLFWGSSVSNLSCRLHLAMSSSSSSSASPRLDTSFWRLCIWVADPLSKRVPLQEDKFHKWKQTTTILSSAPFHPQKQKAHCINPIANMTCMIWLFIYRGRTMTHAGVWGFTL